MLSTLSGNLLPLLKPLLDSRLATWLQRISIDSKILIDLHNCVIHLISCTWICRHNSDHPKEPHAARVETTPRFQAGPLASADFHEFHRCSQV